MKRAGVLAMLVAVLASGGCAVLVGGEEPASVDGEVGRLRLLRVAVESAGTSGSTHVAADDAVLLLTIANFGDAEDALTGVSTNAARQVVLRDGDAESPPQVTVPASGVAELDDVTGRHLELAGLWQNLRAGAHVLVEFEFRDAGPVTVRVPVRRHIGVPVDRVPPPGP